MEREIILDTETTGLDPLNGHRIIEIGCVELVNRLPTGNNFHAYINPQRDVPQEAYNIHGISSDFLKDKPKFDAVVDDFLGFIGNSKVVIHNADFDTRFLNHHLFNIKKPELKKENIFCTLIYARKKFPGQQNSLDALCKRFSIDNSRRTKHGALLDAEILAEVYLELMGGKQNIINLHYEKKVVIEEIIEVSKVDFVLRKFDISEAEEQAHNDMIKSLPNSLWGKITGTGN